MVPVKDYNPINTTPYVTYGLIALNILIFIYELTLPSYSLLGFFRTWAVVPAELSTSFATGVSAVNIEEWLTLVSAQFLHGGFLHVAGNMLYLWIFGNNVEDRLGHVKFLIFYLLCGTIAGLAQWFFAPFSEVPSLGASGAIAGVMGAYIFRFPDVRILTIVPLGPFPFPVRIPAIFYLGIWFLQQAAYGVASLEAPTNIGMENGGVAYWAHAGGFVIGALLGPLFGLFRGQDNTIPVEIAESEQPNP
ncbi:rhomboid family intramembrane serine protease [Pseudanabaena sp. FACHB-2040]|uniref:rhomboid family intramembrane serine protease n=1 Tax=Pseudanabaena sp. FACHB-2040 TaxID=2692859 RepID=UPI001682F60E|nr:rhomboid family intramembrane serine protease [Pseudanabaena sp. FACHB-2040]MBD2258492.1 rhomboid family intramembrane serine protease [Pseudanabaena sp. FACHB-2040]